MLRMLKHLFTLLFLSFVFAIYSQDNTLRLNQIQIIASHNSYKKRPSEKEIKFLLKVKDKLGKENNPIALDYGHLPFDSQFTYFNVRGLEIDINPDPKGGFYYKRKINAFIHGLKQKSGVEELKQPGLKVLHIKDVDYETNYYTFKQSLVALKKWSDEHPNHLPMFINIESKDGAPGDESGLLRFAGFKRGIKFDLAQCDSIDSEIKSVFGNELKGLITPDAVRGNFTTLDEMATKNAWPLLNESRGKVVFIMEGGAVDSYLVNHTALKGRVMFVYSEPGKPEAAFVKRNDATRDKEKIKDLVKHGYIIRTRSDAETWEARKNDYTDMNNAFESGAQITSTDFYQPDLRFSTFQVKFPDAGAGRKNVINSTGEALTE